MTFTNDQYYAISILQKWYRKYNHQVIDIAGTIGTGAWELVQEFIKLEQFDFREIMYLSYDQKQVLELAYKRYHAYYINSIIYNYTRKVNFNSLPVINQNSNQIEYQWKKSVKKKIDPRYKLIVVLDSVLMSKETLNDLKSFGLPIILIRDPMLIPAPDTYTFLREPNIELKEVHSSYIKNPIIFFAHNALYGNMLKPGNYDNVSIISRKQMNLYNLKYPDMIITMNNDTRDVITQIYRERIMHCKDTINVPNERLILMNNLYAHKITNPDEKRVKIYLTRGVIGYINRLNKHVPTTKYVPMEFKTEFYHEVFDDLVMDRHYLNGFELQSKQIIPDEVAYFDYAYTLSPDLARTSHWDKVTLILDNQYDDEELNRRMIYTAITRAQQSLIIMI